MDMEYQSIERGKLYVFRYIMMFSDHKGIKGYKTGLYMDIVS